MHRVASLGENRQLGYLSLQKIRLKRPATFWASFWNTSGHIGRIAKDVIETFFGLLQNYI